MCERGRERKSGRMGIVEGGGEELIQTPHYTHSYTHSDTHIHIYIHHFYNMIHNIYNIVFTCKHIVQVNTITSNFQVTILRNKTREKILIRLNKCKQNMKEFDR